jgi:hypothetical protein
VQYYEIKDLFNTFSSRGLEALQVYEEVEMRIKKDDLNDFILAFENILNTPKQITITNLVDVVGKLKERVNFPIPTREIYYKLASVRYFDEKESPYHYDPEYGKIKMVRWMEASSEVDPFFIAQRLGDMIPLPKLSKEGFLNCLETIQKIADHQLKSIQDLNLAHQQRMDSSNAL